MKKIVISVVGPTASGKTSFALSLAEAAIAGGYRGLALISADSRQVYIGLEVLSGADVPPEFAPAVSTDFSYPFFEHGAISLHGISVVTSEQEWSLAHFKKLALPVIQDAWSNEVLPVLVGGTGLYHRHLFSSDPELAVPPDEGFRTAAESMTAEELQQVLSEEDSERLKKMNHSDLNNPRRLIRAIEISRALAIRSQEESGSNFQVPTPQQHHFVGLRLDLDIIKEKITRRVLDRLDAGVVSEVEQVFNCAEGQKQPSFSALGFKEVLALSQGQITKDECLEHWSRREFSYAKRQFTWWKKDDQIKWFDVKDEGWRPLALTYVKSLLK